jgi:hypothetical protein
MSDTFHIEVLSAEQVRKRFKPDGTLIDTAVFYKTIS